MKYKIFIGFENISSTVTDIKQCFEDLGHECYTAVNYAPNIVELNTANFILQKQFERIPSFKPNYLGSRVRNHWERYVRRRFFKTCLKKCDIFIFIWSTFTTDYSDLEILKKKGKKIVFVFAGDDVRWRVAASQEFEQYGLNPIPNDEVEFYTSKHLEKNLQRLRYAEKYADIIFSRLDQGQLQFRPYYRWNMMVEPLNYKHNCSQREINPIIIHAPTSRKIKGTDYILKAFDRLRGEGYLFTPILVENTPHLEALKSFENADIIIDQLFLPGTGKLASEGLAMGKIVVSLMAYENYPQRNPKDCPIVDANVNNIYEVLKELILNYKRRKKLAQLGRPYAETHLRPKYFCETILALVKDPKCITAEYKPDFFRYDFIPDEDNIELYNTWTDFVMQEPWYKERIKPGERSGLRF